MKEIKCPFCNMVLDKKSSNDNYFSKLICKNCKIPNGNSKIHLILTNNFLSSCYIQIDKNYLSIHDYVTCIWEISSLITLAEIEDNLLYLVYLNELLNSCTQIANKLLKLKEFL